MRPFVFVNFYLDKFKKAGLCIIFGGMYGENSSLYISNEGC